MNFQRLGFDAAPAPGHPIYVELGFVPYEDRTPSTIPGGYAGETLAEQEQAHIALLRE